jgi:hypothetical protein
VDIRHLAATRERFIVDMGRFMERTAAKQS